MLLHVEIWAAAAAAAQFNAAVHTFSSNCSANRNNILQPYPIAGPTVSPSLIGEFPPSQTHQTLTVLLYVDTESSGTGDTKECYSYFTSSTSCFGSSVIK